MKKQFVWIALMMIGYLSISAQNATCCAKKTSCLVQSCSAAKVQNSTSAKVENAEFKSEKEQPSHVSPLNASAAMKSSMNIAASFLSFAAYAWTSLKDCCNPATCDPTTCDPPTCDPSKCSTKSK